MRRHPVFPLATAALLAVIAAPASAADVIALKDGQRPVSGDVTAVSKTEVTIETGLGSVKKTEKIAANDIRRMRWNEEPAGLQLALNAESGGRHPDALQRYETLKQEAGTDNPFLQTDLDFFIARTKGAMALRDESKRDEAVAALTGFLSDHPDSFRYYEALAHLGEVYLAAEEFAKAQQTFTELAQAPWPDYKMQARTARGRLLLKQENVAEALAEFEAVVQMNARGPAEQARRYEAMLGKAVCLQKQDQHQQALAALTEVTNQVPPEETRIQAEAYVRQGDSYRALGRIKAAILAYLHLEVLVQFQSDADLHAEALYHLYQLFKINGETARAEAMAAKLAKQYPTSQWARKLSGGA